MHTSAVACSEPRAAREQLRNSSVPFPRHPHELLQRLGIPPVHPAIQLALDGPVRAFPIDTPLMQRLAQAPADARVLVAQRDDQTHDVLEVLLEDCVAHRRQRLPDLRENGGVFGAAEGGQAVDLSLGDGREDGRFGGGDGGGNGGFLR